MADPVVQQPRTAPSGADLKALAAAAPAPSGDELKAMAAPRNQFSPTDFGQQLLAGIDDVTAALARPLEQTFGTVSLGPEGAEAIGPEETARRRAAGTLGIPGMATEDPETLAGSAGRMGGATAAMVPMIAAAGAAMPLAAAPAGAGVMAKAGVFLRNLLPQAGRTIRASPVTSLAVETGLGASAGAGGFAMRQAFPGSDAAEFVGEVIGGTAPSLVPIRLGVKSAVAGRRLIAQRFAGGRRVEERARRAVPEEVREAVAARLDDPTTLDPETGLPVLTPAQRTGEPGLLALERAVMESSDQLARESDDQIWRANQIIQSAAEDIGTAPASAADETIEGAQEYLRNLLDTRLRVAARRADERVAELGPRMTREQANRIAAEEIEGALDAARLQERDLYRLIPQTAPTPSGNARAAFEFLLDDLSRAQADDMPAIARQLLDPESNQYLGAETTIKELRGLQSELRRVARNARAGDNVNLNQARIADEIANAITEDIAQTSAGSEVAEAVSAAVGFSRDLNERFSRGTVGRILGRDVRGGRRVTPGLTLEQSIGMTGPKAREAFDDLTKAFASPEAPGSEVLVGAAEDYLRGRFLTQAVENGALNTIRAQRFLRDNAEILTRLPDLQRRLVDTIAAGNLTALRQAQRGRVSFDNPRIAKTTMYLQKGPAEAFRQIAKRKPRDAAEDVRVLLNTVNRDASGEATEGLKAAFRDWLMVGARAGGRDAQGRAFVSGMALRETLDQPAVAAMTSRILSAAERKRLDVIVTDLTRLEKRLAADLPLEGVIGDTPSRVLETIAGIAGAAAGRAQGRRLGAGGTVQIPGIMANRFRELVRAGVRDPATRLIVDAIRDEGLFRELLLAPLKAREELGARASVRLNAWAAAVAAEQGGVLDAPEDEQTQSMSP